MNIEKTKKMYMLKLLVICIIIKLSVKKTFDRITGWDNEKGKEKDDYEICDMNPVSWTK